MLAHFGCLAVEILSRMDWDGLLRHRGSRMPGCVRAGAFALAVGTAGCSGVVDPGVLAPATAPPATAPPAATVPAANPVAAGTKVGLILPLSAPGNASTVGLVMRNAAEMAVAEMAAPSIQLIVKDDSGTAQGSRFAVQQALDEGVDVILGPVFATSVTAVRQIATGRGVPIIAFSTDATAAAPGAYLLGFFPAADAERIATYAISQGKRSFLALVPSTPYGMVVEAAFTETVKRDGGRVLAIEHYKEDRSNTADPAKPLAEAAKLIAAAAAGADALFMPGGGDAVTDAVAALADGGVDPRRLSPAGHPAVGRSENRHQSAAGGGPLSRSRPCRLSRLCQSLPHPLRPGPATPGGARVRRGRHAGGAGADCGFATDYEPGSDRSGGVPRDRGRVPVPRRRDQSAWACGAAGDAIGRTSRLAGAARFQLRVCTPSRLLETHPHAPRRWPLRSVQRLHRLRYT